MKMRVMIGIQAHGELIGGEQEAREVHPEFMDLNVLRKIGAMNMTRSKINTLSSSQEDGVVIEVEVKQEEEAEAAIEGITEEEQN